MRRFERYLGAPSELLVIAGVIAILLVLFFPIPAALLDLLLVANISFALLILLLTFYADKPLSFSTFPSVLLIATLLRLSLNVAATRLILTDAYAGKVIGAIGSYVVAGNYLIGLVVFFILIVVQFVVVTAGAQRVAEVAARFTLDAMPGKQMSIDADLNMGLISEEDARARRKEIEREANFYGAMDGASKFVKGDAVAGIVIILINIIGGLAVGMTQRGMSWAEALHSFTLLTVGDGIVTQIPALVIATGTGIIVTRAATDASLSRELLMQIAQYPKSLVIVSVALLLAALLPGIPALPVLIVLGFVGAFAYFALRRGKAVADAGSEDKPATSAEDDLQSVIRQEPIEIEVHPSLVPIVGEADGLLMRRLQAFRKQFATDSGFVLPKMRLRSETRRNVDSYVLRFAGAQVGAGILRPGKVLAVCPPGTSLRAEGEDTKDPTFGLPARWIDEEAGAEAKASRITVVEPLTVLVTHFSEMLRGQVAMLMSRAEADKMVARVRQSQPSLVEELVPTIMTLGDVQRVLQLLLAERVPLTQMDTILEVLADQGRTLKDPEVLVEKVRERLGAQICQRLTDETSVMHVLTLDPELDRALRSDNRPPESRTGIALEPARFERLVQALVRKTEEMMAGSKSPVLLCSPAIRRTLRRVAERAVPHLSVVSTSEIPGQLTVKSFATVAA
ncbi:MAG: flagellar biosynthesis protein FlhA [Hyphomonadaceae bacterium]|nr:flagellar biosynthesis protein FlhA [Hyphomonadaceae bacterium]